MSAFIQLDIAIRFRAFGVTFGNWADKVKFPLPSVLAVVTPFVETHTIGTYSDHGVKIVASLVKA
jgi:hypothetical protein